MTTSTVRKTIRKWYDDLKAVDYDGERIPGFVGSVFDDDKDREKVYKFFEGVTDMPKGDAGKTVMYFISELPGFESFIDDDYNFKRIPSRPAITKETITKIARDIIQRNLDVNRVADMNEEEFDTLAQSYKRETPSQRVERTMNKKIDELNEQMNERVNESRKEGAKEMHQHYYEQFKQKLLPEMQRQEEENDYLKEELARAKASMKPKQKELFKELYDADAYTMKPEELAKSKTIKGMFTDDESKNEFIKQFYSFSAMKLLKDRLRRAKFAKVIGNNPDAFQYLPEGVRESLNKAIEEKFETDELNKKKHWLKPKAKPEWQKAVILYKMNPMLDRNPWSTSNKHTMRGSF